jgi:hypothetical protein
LDIDILMRLHKQQPDQGYAAAALQVSEKGRARSCWNCCAKHAPRSGRELIRVDRSRTVTAQIHRGRRRPSNTAVERQAHRGTSDSATREIDGLTMEYEQVQGQIRQQSPRYAALVQPAPLEFGQIQKQVLDPDTLLLEYALGDEKGFVGQ